MKTSDYQCQQLHEQATAMYNSEKEISGIFVALQMNTTEASLKEGITREAEENKRHCERLEGLISVLDQTPFKNNRDHDSRNSFIRQLSIMMKRIIFKRANFGYQTAILASLDLGQIEIANLLRYSLEVPADK